MEEISVSSRARSAANSLLIDAFALSVVDALTAQEIPSIVLKGPTIGRWLYEPGERSYVDVDLLVARSDLARAEEVVAGLGLEGPGALPAEVDRPVYREWQRDDGMCLDVHVTLNLLEQIDPERVWGVLYASSEEMDLAGGRVRALKAPARALHVALHALGHRDGPAQPLEDLRRAVARLSLDDWRHAAEMARRLEAERLLGEALRLLPEGAALAERLSLPEGRDPRSVVRDAASSEVTGYALGVDWFARASWRERLALLRTKFAPSPTYLRARSSLANRGTVGLVLAYLARPFVVLARSIRGAAVMKRAVKGSKRDGR